MERRKGKKKKKKRENKLIMIEKREIRKVEERF